jgi:hypothetical protein
LAARFFADPPRSAGDGRLLEEVIEREPADAESGLGQPPRLLPCAEMEADPVQAGGPQTVELFRDAGGLKQTGGFRRKELSAHFVAGKRGDLEDFHFRAFGERREGGARTGRTAADHAHQGQG